ncbi:class IIb bacteriocin, lactobin A/cerein 7B family [Aliifodinibius sp. S!AR15-10]|uniref:class IIb bacteriocin, lactobin A/cerein 7B family n=1 Tax=Aliifodinibius sp. S!AR15-10 TaxID=2950437 RepID=UPI0028566ECD|nr:class IIb bacteriocin, lactobin A/cerein 7B family [Aliifodinibius sp. S!AR15-10]MDR8389585.1 class IIb bacteriocin, lactobin A/cerein 7B family [Aliifodinibius sp. S!AR15-10]
MNPKVDLESLEESELKNINGGIGVLATIGAVAGIYAAVLAGAAAVGYADGKADCG